MQICNRCNCYNEYNRNDRLKKIHRDVNAQVPPNNMLALRVLSNMLSAEQGQILAFRSKVQLLRIIRDIPQPYTKPLQVRGPTKNKTQLLPLSLLFCAALHELSDSGRDGHALAQHVRRP